MAIEEWKKIENEGDEDLEKPLMRREEEEEDKEASRTYNENGSIQMVYLSTFVAVCGFFEFGSCVGYSAPAQAAIREDLHLSLSEYSMFGSILTIGAMFGAVASGRIADYIGRKGTMRMSACFCIIGWMAIYISKVSAAGTSFGCFLAGLSFYLKSLGLLLDFVPVLVIAGVLLRLNL